MRRSPVIALACLSGVLLLPFVVPEPVSIPVQGATSSDWNEDAFWYEPWGRSGVHKGVDIFAKAGQPVVAVTHFLILYKGELKRGGKVVLGLGPKWRLHYFAHLEQINPRVGLLVGDPLGKVGNTGNAAGKPPHLHYAIISILPRPWKMDSSTQGYKKAFYMNPIIYIKRHHNG